MGRRVMETIPGFSELDRFPRLAALVAQARKLPAVRAAVVHPCDRASLEGAMAARALNMIDPILVGPRRKIEATAASAQMSLQGVTIEDAPHSHAAAARAVELVRAGRAQAIMKGSLHTDEVMSAIVARDTGLRTERRVSHIFVIDAPLYSKLMLVSDAAINIAPDLVEKRDIVQNAIDLARAIGIARPKVALLSAVETVTPKLASTVEAAALCKMADRGQIVGGELDGPLAFDNAISRQAAEDKGIVSNVAGDADILIVPDLVSGNVLAKQLVFLAGAEYSGLVLGARCPVMLTSRADGPPARIASAALAQLYVHWVEAQAAAKAAGE
ncbi:MAG: bifunctional enoyl-CoA hydratase/phosphate acetyltransferase [Beijerinckiaceae bacterium]